ncbi:MAG: phosphoadenosine phosphosulfate reductase family protein [Deltaproteobacteria bacterium]|nr:phosphoadenosine phosphosulfate reductase family protein [Deltaproteobacteria bacterium]
MNLVKETLQKLELIFFNYNNPVILCSFGKDSIVLLHLARQIKKDIPVILWRENSQLKKYEFANRIIDEWHLKVYDFPPAINDIVYRHGKMDGVGFYMIGGNYVYKAIELSNPNGHFACSMEDILMKPTCERYNFKWDAVLSGHKKADIDALLGKVELKTDLIQSGNVSLCYPLFDWTDADIWEYIHSNNVPYNEKRYGKDGVEFKDKTYNENYHAACVKCLDPNEQENVYCEKEKKEVQNMGKLIDYKKRLKAYTETLKEYMNLEEV